MQDFLRNDFKKDIEKAIKQLEEATGTVKDELKKVTEGVKRKRSKVKKNKWKKIKDHANVYVTGLPKYVKIDEFAQYFSKCGIIKKDPITEEPRVKLYKDEKGEFKGDGLVMYLKPESVKLAVEILDESYYTPENKIRVSKAVFQTKGKEFKNDKNDLDKSASKRLINRKIAIAKNQNRELCWDDEEEVALAGKSGLRIVILRPMFDMNEESEDKEEFYNELGKEVGLECQRIGGKIEKLTVFKDSEAGAVAVKFKEAEGAAKCIRAMDGRFFSGRSIICEYFDGTDHRAVKEETQEERDKRIDQFGKWLNKD